MVFVERIGLVNSDAGIVVDVLDTEFRVKVEVTQLAEELGHDT